MTSDFRYVARKRFGQHFLKDKQIVCKIVQAAQVTEKDVVLEVGPGPGILTRALLESPLKKLYCIEIDAQFYPALEKLESQFPDRFVLIKGNALKYDLVHFHEPVKIVANLPYNVGTALLLRWLQQLDRVKSITVMLQKEVVSRIGATLRTKDYSSLSIICQTLCVVKKLFDVGPGAFSPPPKVVSSVIQMLPHAQVPSVCEIAHLECVSQLLFQKRRKMLRVTLKPFLVGQENFFKAHNFSETARPEELSVAEMMRLAKLLRI